MNAAEDWALVRQVILEPEAFCLRLYRSRRLFKYEIRSEDVRQWLDDLRALARIAESAPPLRGLDEASPMREDPDSSRKMT
jgi:hypothetical protein